MYKEAHILIVDDEAAMRDACRQTLQRDGLQVFEARNGNEALTLMAKRLYDLVILDLKMPGIDGMEVLRRIRLEHSQTPVVVITGYPSIESAIGAIKSGAVDFLPKPFSSESLRVIIGKALDYSRLRRQNDLMRGQFTVGARPTEMIGRTSQMKAIFDLIDRVAPTDSTVLITGESGTGKELVARSLHLKSLRSSGPFVAVDCATLVGTLFESELFGHVKGSFTGAVATTHGRFEMADTGTLFLDEVSCIDPAMQAKLLRVIEEREFTRVGSGQTIAVDVRIIAATNTDLVRAVEEGAFREDLFYRLSVVPIVLPPLRQRKADIPVLAEHFLRLHCRRRNKEVVQISVAAMDSLLQHDWPGNVRELSNAIERAVVLAEGQEILPDHLLHHGVVRQYTVKTSPEHVVALSESERMHIEKALQESRGNKSLAARMLGIDRKTLWRKLRQYNRQPTR